MEGTSSKSTFPDNLCAFLLRNEYSIDCAYGLCFEPVMIQIKVVHHGKSFCLHPLVMALVFLLGQEIKPPRDRVILKSVNIFTVILNCFSVA